MNLNDMIAESVSAIQSKNPNFKPKIAIVSGSGLSALADAVNAIEVISYADIPHFPVSTVEGHSGQLVLGHLSGVPVIFFQGRVHLYEGIDPAKIKLLIRVAKKLGCKNLILTNAAGSLRTEVGAGELSLITDHINFQYINPLVGPNDDEYGPRFPVMNGAYNAALNQQLRDAAKALSINLHEGVYMGLMGPCFETPAEIRAFKVLGADLVGMSTVSEVMVARHCGLNVAAVSAVVNLAAGLSDEPPSHEETLKYGQIASENLIKLLVEFCRRFKA